MTHDVVVLPKQLVFREAADANELGVSVKDFSLQIGPGNDRSASIKIDLYITDRKI